MKIFPEKGRKINVLDFFLTPLNQLLEQVKTDAKLTPTDLPYSLPGIISLFSQTTQSQHPFRKSTSFHTTKVINNALYWLLSTIAFEHMPCLVTRGRCYLNSFASLNHCGVQMSSTFVVLYVRL